MKKIIFLSFVFAFSLSAQHIGYLIPAGGQRGTTAEIQIGGQNYSGEMKAQVSGPGITVESVTTVPGFPHPVSKQRQHLAKWLRNIQKGEMEMPVKPDDPEELKTWRKHAYFDTLDKISPLQRHLVTSFLFLPQNSLQMSPSINSVAIVRLKIAKDAPLGRRELRLIRRGFRASNPLPFYVDDIPNIREPFMPAPPQKREQSVFAVPAVINGQILAKESDSWYFSAKKGEKLSFRTFARKMIPFMGDCVPGYFQCLLEIRDMKNNLLAYADDNGSDPDPILNWTVPQDGKYRLIVRDALYRGRADFVYRVEIRKGVIPFEFAKVTRYPQIPRKEITALPSNRKTSWPVFLHGTMQKGKQETVVIHAEKGEKIVGEVFARRLNSRMDSMLQVTDFFGNKVAFNDDFARPNISLTMQNTDSMLCFTAPRSGDYTFTLSETSGNGGPEYQYWLRIDRMRPSFTIHFVPSAVFAFSNGNAPWKINITPHEGFNSDISLRLEDAPGYWISGSNIIPAGTKEATLTLVCANEEDPLRRFPTACKLIAESKYGRGSVIAGDETTQAFAYTHAVPSNEFLISCGWGPTGCSSVWYADKTLKRIRIKPGSTVQIQLRQRRLPKNASLAFMLKNAPKGITLCKTEDIPAAKNAYGKIMLSIKAEKEMKAVRFLLAPTVIYNYESFNRKQNKYNMNKSEFLLPALLFEVGE